MTLTLLGPTARRWLVKINQPENLTAEPSGWREEEGVFDLKDELSL